MIVLPLGLGSLPRRIPLVTLAICIVWIVAWLVDSSADRIALRVFKAVAESGVRDRARELFVDYCLARQGTRAHCERYAVLVWPGFPGQSDSTGKNANAAPRDRQFKGQGSKVDINVIGLSRERAKAQKARSELEDCRKSPRCLQYKDILYRFLDRYRSDASMFMQLKSYTPFIEARNTYRRTLNRICQRYECLVPGHITVSSLAWAQVRHGGFLHVFGNLLMLLVFGSYVEQRMLRSAFLLTLFIGGMLGLAMQAWFFSGIDSLALGGSAIVCVAVGMFYVFFLRHRMVFLVWLPRKLYLGSRFHAPVLWCIPILYVLTDVAGSLDSGFADLFAARVAHGAHLSGLLFGVVVAWLWCKVDHMPATYIYRGEKQDVARLAASQDIREIILLAEQLAATNTENIDAKEIAARQILAWLHSRPANVDPHLIKRVQHYLVAHLQTVFAVRLRSGQFARCLSLLDQIPEEMPFRIYLNHLGQIHILRLADAALSHYNPIISLRLYDFFLHRFPRTRKATAVAMSACSYLDTLPKEAAIAERVLRFIRHHGHSPLAPRLRLWLKQERAA